jgi:membrane protease YdiL (CAAX protease family)
LRHYRRGVVGEWSAVAVVAVIGALTRRGRSSIGLTGHGFGGATTEVIEVAVLLGVTAVAFRFPSLREVLRRQAKGFLALLPRTRTERMVFAGLAVTAGVCEEILFRGFGIAYVRWLWPGASHAWLITVTSVGFGFAHLYQGPRGVLLTGVVGALFASVTLSSGSLVPAMVMHALLDLRVLALPDLEEVGATPGVPRGGGTC